MLRGRGNLPALLTALALAACGRDARVGVRVVDGSGRPLEDARVRLCEVGGETLPRSDGRLGPPATFGYGEHDAESDARGRARFEELAPGAFRAWAWKPGWYAAASEAFELDEGGRRELTLALAPVAATQLVRGVVVDPAGAPVADATVRLHERMGAGLATRRARTDAAGRFLVALHAQAEEAALEVVAWRRSLGAALVEPVSGGEGERRVALPPARRVELVVSDAEGAVVERPSVRVERLVLGRWLSEPTQLPPAPGEPVIRDRPASSFRVRVGGRELFGPFDPSAVGERIELRLGPPPPPPASVRGLVTSDGAPVAGARVRLSLDMRLPAGELDLEHPSWFPRGSLLAPRTALTGEDGRFELPLEGSGTYVLVARTYGRGSGRLEGLGLDAARGAEGLALELEPPGAIRGRVRLPAGAAPEEHLVGLEGADTFWTAVDEEGRFFVEGLDAGRWALSLAARPSGSWLDGLAPGGRDGFVDVGPPDPPGWLACETPRVVELEPGGDRELGWDLTRAPACRLAGRLLLDGHGPFDWPGDPVPRTPSDSRRATLERDDASPSMRARCEIGADGRFALAVDEPGPYRLRLVLPQRYGPDLILLDRVELAAGATRWSRDLATARLALELGPGTVDEPWDLVWRGRGPGELRAFTWEPARDPVTGLHHFPRVLAGAGGVHRQHGFWQLEPLVSFELLPGETRALELP
jgi:hypothetical protein